MAQYGFFHFYSRTFPQSTIAVSVRHGQPILLKTVFSKAKFWRMCIEDPFETHDASYCHDLGMHIERNRQPIISQKISDAFHELTYILNDITAGCTTNGNWCSGISNDHSLALRKFLGCKSDWHSTSSVVPFAKGNVKRASAINENLKLQKNNNFKDIMPLGQQNPRNNFSALQTEIHADEHSKTHRIPHYKIFFAGTTNTNDQELFRSPYQGDKKATIQSISVHTITDDNKASSKEGKPLSKNGPARNKPIQSMIIHQEEKPFPKKGLNEDTHIQCTGVQKASIELFTTQTERTLTANSPHKIHSIQNVTMQTTSKNIISNDGKKKALSNVGHARSSVLQIGLEENVTVGDGEIHFRKSSRKNGGYNKGKKCFNCGNIGHTSAACRKTHGNKSCYSCGKEGHVTKYCPNKRE